MNERTFYPMLSGTMKSLLSLTKPEDMPETVEIIITYPKHHLDGDQAANPVICAIMQELHRQYGRWTQGGKYAK